MNTSRYVLVSLVVVGLLSPPVAMIADAGPNSCERRNNNTFKKLLECVTLDGVRQHQAAFQAIADANGGNRATGSPGYVASVDYVVGLLSDAGYNVTVQPFDHVVYQANGPSTLEQTAPGTVVYVEETDYSLFSHTDPGDVTGSVTAVALQLGPGNGSTSGCEPTDFAGFPVGDVALLQRGACAFRTKAENAAAAGAVGAIIFNQGNETGREGLFLGTLSTLYSGGIPVMSASYDRGVEWSTTPGLVMHMIADVTRGNVTDYNVLAESNRGDPSNVVMVGAHLDSVAGGPGINDNGSGSAAILEIARKMAKVRPRNQVRFAWWGGMESGLIGSNHYVSNLTSEEIDVIALYLNFDTIGSPNFVRFIYDGDGSAFGSPGPAGSDAIEALFENLHMSAGLPFEPTEINFRSDYSAFISADIPFGGVFSGQEGIKTADQAAIFGGTAGDQYDPCYHLACDTFDNISFTALDQNADAAAHAVLTFAMTTSSVNGTDKANVKANKTVEDLEFKGSLAQN